MVQYRYMWSLFCAAARSLHRSAKPPRATATQQLVDEDLETDQDTVIWRRAIFQVSLDLLLLKV
jgi:hypothetical protein